MRCFCVRCPDGNRVTFILDTTSCFNFCRTGVDEPIRFMTTNDTTVRDSIKLISKNYYKKLNIMFLHGLKYDALCLFDRFVIDP